MVDALITFSEGQDILASEANQNNQFLLSKLSDNAMQLTTYVEQEITSMQSNIASVQSALQQNIDAANANANTKLTANLSQGGNGYCKFSNGLIVQWGGTNGAFSGYRTIVLPTPFTTANYKPVACALAGGDYDANWDVRDITTTSFAINQPSSGAKQLTWLAIGY